MKEAVLAERHFSDPEVLLGYMRQTRKPVFHKSNVFFRDIQFAIRDYFDTVVRKPITLTEAEVMAAEVVRMYTASGLLREVNNLAYVLHAPDWATTKEGTYSMLTLSGTPLPAKPTATAAQGN